MLQVASSAGCLVALGCIVLTSCKPKEELNYEAVLSLPPDDLTASSSSLVEELTARAELLGLPLIVREAEGSNKLIKVQLYGAGKEDALSRLDRLCVSGKISIRAIHDRSAYITDIASKDPSQLPPDHQILLFDTRGTGHAKGQKLAVAKAEILNNTHVESALATRDGANMVHISLTGSGLRRIRSVTEKMQKGRSRLAIIYDERIISAPVVAEELWTPVTLEGFNSFEHAESLATSLNKPLSSNLLIESLIPLVPQAK
jgi:preprotein translocase subunit SecD